MPISFEEEHLGAAYSDKRLAALMSELKANHEKSEAEFEKHRELLKRGERDPEDLKIMLETIQKRRTQLDEEEKLCHEALAKINVQE